MDGAGTEHLRDSLRDCLGLSLSTGPTDGSLDPNDTMMAYVTGTVRPPFGHLMSEAGRTDR